MRIVWPLVIALMATAAAACASSDSGAYRRPLCGTVIAEGSGEIRPWYVDASSRPTTTVRLPAPGPDENAGVWVQVSGDCRHGAEVSLPAAAVVRQRDVVRATDGRDVAIRFSAVRSGTSELTVSTARGQLRRVSVRVER